jgi:hypothetical protein
MVTALEVVSPFASNPTRPTIAPLARTLSSLSVTEATSRWSAFTGTHAIALMATRSAGKRSSASTVCATAGRTHTITTRVSSTTVWLSGASSTVAKRWARPAATSALRGETSTFGASVDVLAQPRDDRRRSYGKRARASRRS